MAATLSVSFSTPTAFSSAACRCRDGWSAEAGVWTIDDHAAWNAVTTNPFSVKTPGDETPVELQALARFDPVPPSRWRVPPFRLQREEGAITSMLSGFIGGVDTHAEHWRVRLHVSVLKSHQPLPVAVRVGKAVCDSLPRHLEYQGGSDGPNPLSHVLVT